MATFEHNGTNYTLRCDVLAISRCEANTDYRLERMGSGGVVEVASWVYFFAQRGEQVEGRPFDLTLEDFLGGVTMGDVEKLSDAVADLLDTGNGKKKPGESP